MAKIGFDDAFKDDFKKLLAELNAEFAKTLKNYSLLNKELQKSIGAVKAAKSVNDLNTATKKAATTASKLTTEEKELNRIIKATETATTKAAQATTTHGIAMEKAKETQRRATAEAKKLAKAQLGGVKSTNKWGKAMGSFAFKFNALGNIAANVFAKITSGIVGYIKDAAKMAAAAEGVERAFRTLNDPALLGKLREATRSTVSDVKLMTAAIKANNFQIPLENLPKFFEFAARRANETGEEVDYLVESIVNGIARKSLPILDNLGFSASQVREEMNKTGDMALAVSNIIEQSMGDANRPLATTSELYAKSAAEAENMKRQFGQIANLFATKLLPLTGKFVSFLKDALQTQAMIERQVLDATTLYAIEQDRVEVLELANRLQANGVKLAEGETFEKKAALLLLKQYRSLLASTNESEVKKIELVTSQIKQLEALAGLVTGETKETEAQVIARDNLNKAYALSVKLLSQIKSPEDLDKINTDNFLKGLALEDLLIDAVSDIELDQMDFSWFNDGFEDEGDNAVETAKAIFEKLFQIGEAQRKRDKDANSKAAQERIATEESAINSINGLVTESFNVFSNINQRKQDSLDARLDKGLISEDNYDKQINALRKKQDSIQKAQAIFSIGVNTAVAAMQVAGQTGVGAAIAVPLVLALGAAQIAAVLSEPVPQYAKGTNYAKGGPAIAGEKGVELVTEPSGKTWLTPDKPSLVDIPKGSKVTPAHITEQFMRYANIANAFEGKADDGMITMMAGKLNEVKQAVKHIPGTSLSITPAGFYTGVTRGSTTVKSLKRYFK